MAKQFNQGKDDDLFAATPPLEALRMVLSQATTRRGNKCLMIVDVSRAYMYAPVNAGVCVCMYAHVSTLAHVHGHA